MRAVRTVCVCGVPGVGKTTLIRAAIGRVPEARSCEAYDLVAQARAAATDSTGTFPVAAARRAARYFELLARGFAMERSGDPRAVMMLECPSVLHTESGWFEMPLSVLERIEPAALVHVEDDPEAIAERCMRDRSTVRLARSVIELARYQDRSLQTCERRAYALRCPVHRIRAGAWDELTRLVRSLLPT